MKKYIPFIIFALTLSTPQLFAQGIISTIAGNGKIGFYGDGGIADTCKFFNPLDISLDATGNIYISDVNNFRVRKISKATNIITTIAGNGIDTFSIDSVVATTTGINPDGIFADAAGNIYIADVRNNRIRRVDAGTGKIATIAGNGTQGYSGDTGLAVNERLYYPTDVCQDNSGNIYIADYGNNRIRKVNATTGKISTVAGNGTAGYSGDGGDATSAQLNAPTYLCLDTGGNIFISDVNNNIIRRVDAASGKISTVAGNDTAGFSGDGGLAIKAKLLSPAGIFVTRNNDLFIADENNDRVRKVSGGYISTVAGGATISSIGDGNVSTNARLSSPAGIYVDSTGALYIADMQNQRIRHVEKPNNIEVIHNLLIQAVYPNPSSGRFTIMLNNNNAIRNIEVLNILGSKVFEASTVNNKIEIDLYAQQAGIYLVRVSDPIYTTTVKVLINR